MRSRFKLLGTGADPGIRMIMLAVLVLPGSGTSCGGASECSPGQACEVRGYIVVGPEVWAFQHCGSADLLSINVKGYEPGFEKLDSALHESMECTEDPPGTWTCSSQSAAVYARMTATISAAGHYGPSGKYEGEVEMIRIHEASSSAHADCAKPDPAFP